MLKNFLNHVRLVDELMIRISPLAFWTSEGIEAELVDEPLNFSKTLGDFKPSMLQDLEAAQAA